MIYGYDVKKDGIMYKAGVDVPTSMPMPVIEEEKEEIPKKPSRKTKKEEK